MGAMTTRLNFNVSTPLSSANARKDRRQDLSGGTIGQ